MRWGPAPLFLEGICTEASHYVVIVGRQDVHGTCMCHNSKNIRVLSGRVVLCMRVCQEMRPEDAPEELSNMSMPFVMPISLVVTFLLQAWNLTISPGSPKIKRKLHKILEGRRASLCLRHASMCKLCS